MSLVGGLSRHGNPGNPGISTIEEYITQKREEAERAGGTWSPGDLTGPNGAGVPVRWWLLPAILAGVLLVVSRRRQPAEEAKT